VTAPAAAPPPGPGVYPPFPAPPTEGRGTRLWLGVGLGALVVLLICGAGAAAVIGVGTFTSRAFDEQARVVGGRYLDAVKEHRLAEAYGMLCRHAKQAETQAEYEARVGAGAQLTSYRIGSSHLTTSGLSAPVDLAFADGDHEQARMDFEQNRDTGAFEVCGVEE
jgi:hypothetical protein